MDSGLVKHGLTAVIIVVVIVADELAWQTSHHYSVICNVCLFIRRSRSKCRFVERNIM